ncbi:MAG: TetR family transcriptional regulator [Actinophytocola sp.]|nr:TetR family transcriptional regulator [Actinophytocola sp.]
MSVEPSVGRRPGRRDEILASFTRHVAQDGYDGANFAMVANELGMSKGTIVHHYGTKDRLLAALHESYMRKRLAEARLIVERLRNPAQQLAGMLFAFVMYQVHDRDATIAFQREISRISGEEGIRLRDEYLELVRDVLRRGIESGQFRDGDVNVRSLLTFGCSQWAWTWFQPDGRLSVEEVGSAFVDLVLGGLLVRRTELAKLADVDGPTLRAVRDCLAAVDGTLADA